MKKRTIQISSYFLRSTLIFGVGSMLVLFLLWVLVEYRHLGSQLEHERQTYIAEKKAWLQYVVDTNVDYIYGEYIKSDAIVRAEVKARVLEGAAIAGNLAATHGGRLSVDQLEILVREALRPIRFFSGRGYFFAINLDGTEELYADKPEFEGKNLSYMVDNEGRRVIPEMIALAKAEGEGFYGYNWTKPGTDRNDHPKIAYLKLLPELGWVLGSGEYLEDVEADQRGKTLAYLAGRTIEKDGYLFGGTWDGISLLGPMQGQNMLQTQDVNGLFIVKELIARSREGGGFVEYVVPPFPGVKPLPKLSYSTGLPEWEWYIGYGVYTEEIDTRIRAEQQRLLWSVLVRLLMIVLFGGLSMGVIVLTGRRLGRHFRADHRIFMHYFGDAAVHGHPIDIGTLQIEEYQHIAALINDMVKRKAELDDQLRIGLEERSVLLREVHHRVKNNFQMTASLLSMQKDLCADGTAQKALQTAHDRIYSMASVHNLFYQSNSFSNIDIGTYLGDIIANVRQSYNRDACTVRIVHEIQPFEIGLERAIPLGLIINELITNSYKHAFAGRREGTIRLSIGPENTECLVAYSDDGVGLAAAADQVQGQGQDQAKRGLGMELVRILMGQLGGAMTVENNGGYRVVLRFPRQ